MSNDLKAHTLEEVVIYFDPSRALQDEKLAAWFVEREGSERGTLRTLLKIPMNPQKILLTGHRGGGKTTELNKLAEELADRYHVIKIDVVYMTGGRTNLLYEDVMLAIATRVTSDCIESGFIGRPLVEPVRAGLTKVVDWWERLVGGLNFQQLSSETETGLRLKTLLGEVEVGVRSSSSTREKLTSLINRQMTELVRHLDWVIEQAEAVSGLRVLIVVEELDKVDLESANNIFREHARTIILPKASMIFSFPMPLRQTDHYSTIRLDFPEVYSLPNIAPRHMDGTSNATGMETLRELVLARMDEQLIEPDALDLVAEASSGIPSSLVFLVRRATLFAMDRRNPTQQITSDDVRKAIKKLRTELRGPLTRKDIEVLRKRHQDHRLTNDAVEQRLLYNGTLIDYANGETWCDAHVALWPLLEYDYGDNTETSGES